MTTTTLLGWEPPDSYPNFYRPVQVEDATGGISICPLPDGRAILMWPNGADCRFAVIDSPTAALNDNIVAAPDIQTAYASGFDMRRCVVYPIGSDVYASIFYDDSSTLIGGLKIIKLDDPNNPTTWSVIGTLNPVADTHGDIVFENGWSTGQVYVTSGGRWILASTYGYWNSGFGGFAGYRAGIYTSDNAGASWTRRFDYGTGSVATSAGPISTTIVRNPADGLLYSSVTDGSAGGSGHTVYTITSADDGTSWVDPVLSGETTNHVYFLDNGITAYLVRAALTGRGEARLLSGGAIVGTGVQLWPASMGDTFPGKVQFQIYDGVLWTCLGEFIGTISKGWQVGRIAW